MDKIPQHAMFYPFISKLVQDKQYPTVMGQQNFRAAFPKDKLG